YTAVGFLERVRWWLSETAHGRLHDIDQPLDPLFALSRDRFVLPPAAISAGQELFFGVALSGDSGVPVLLRPLAGLPPDNLDVQRCIATISVVTTRTRHGRIRQLPQNLAELVDSYRELGTELVPLFVAALQELYHRPQSRPFFDCRLMAIVKTPLARDRGASEVTFVKGFLCDSTAKDENAGAIIRH
ncbi:MAG: hypothetical protein H0X34_20015, partial [Chthoniobacterales bacterium]|nr:hypothetical protein [Chthoniobacterales bacterium]